MQKAVFYVLFFLITANLHCQSESKTEHRRLWIAIEENNKKAFVVELEAMRYKLRELYTTHDRYLADTCNDYKYTALGYAVLCGREDFVEQILAKEKLMKDTLIENYTDVIHKGNRFTALDITINRNNSCLTILLASNKYDVNTVYHEGNASPLALACRMGSSYIMERLLERGADINQSSEIYLWKYACSGWRYNAEVFQDTDDKITTYPIHEFLKAGGSMYLIRNLFERYPIKHLSHVDSQGRTALELAKEMKVFYDQLFEDVVNDYWGDGVRLEPELNEDDEWEQGDGFITSLENTVIFAQDNIEIIEAWLEAEDK